MTKQGVANRNSAAVDTVIFLHIHKAAGTTLHRIVERQYDPAQVWSFDESHNFDDFQRLSEIQRAGIRMLKGHMIFGMHEWMPGESTYFTLLREPIERAISFYYWIRRNPHHHHYDLITSEDLSLEEYLETGQANMMDNGQTRMLAGVLQYEFPFGECTEELLEAAKFNLTESFSVVGLVERFDETLLLLKRAFGWNDVYYAQQNVTRNRPGRGDLPQATLELLAEQNGLDLQLYGYAKELFGERVRQQGPLFPLEVKWFQWRHLGTDRLTQARQELRRHSVRMWLRGWIWRLRAGQ